MLNDEIKHLLSQYIDDTLEDADRIKVENLLKSDPEVAEYHKQLLKLGQMTDEFELEADPNFWQSQRETIFQKIDMAEDAGIEPMPIKKKSMPYKWLAIAASVALVAVISIFELKYDSPDKIPFSGKVEHQSPIMEPEPVADDMMQVADSEKDQQIDRVVASKPDLIDKDKKEDVTVEPAVVTIMADMPDEEPHEQPKKKAETIAVSGDREALEDLAEVTIPAENLSEYHGEEMGDIATQNEIVIETKSATIDYDTPDESNSPEPARPSMSPKKEKAGIPIPVDESSFDSDIRSNALQGATHYELENKTKVTADILAEGIPKPNELVRRVDLNDTLAFFGDMPRASEYFKWRAKYDSLESMYDWQLTARQRHKNEILAKSRKELPPSPTEEAKGALAESCYNIARLSPRDQEKDGYVEMLERIKSIANDALIKQIDKYLSDLEAESK